jgi:hypothetical protein
MAVPFCHKVELVISTGFPVPETVRVKDVRVTTVVQRFVSWTCWTDTLEAPAGWFELPGGLEPWEAITVIVVQLGVAVGVWVEVAEGTETVGEMESVGVKVRVKVAVPVGVRVGV